MTESVARIRRRLEDVRASAALLTAQTHVRWATGFTGSNGMVLIDPDRVVLITDPRYQTQAPAECPGAEVVVTPDALVHRVRDFVAGKGDMVIDPQRTTLGLYRSLIRELPDLELREVPGWLDSAIAVKDAREVQRIAAAQAVTDAVWSEVPEFVRPGSTERDIAAEIVYRHLSRGADRMAFEPIVAAGPNAALPHGHPSDRPVVIGELVLVDMGCFLNGYASDMTRMVCIGRVPNELSDIYEVVRQAQEAALRSARAGMIARELDAVARDVIGQAGLGEYFVHGLGHGLGIEVHEWPRVGRNAEYALPPGCVVTIEPGVYIPGKVGVRIEDIVVLEEGSARNLTRSSHELTIIG